MEKKVNSQVSTIVKNANFSTSINPNLLKIELQVVLDSLKHGKPRFHYLPKYRKFCRHYALRARHRNERRLWYNRPEQF